MKDAAGTRQRVLQAALGEMHARGFAGASLERVLESTGLTKGALYHHFRSKRALGQAVVTELLGGMIADFGRRMKDAPDPVAELRAWLAEPLPGPIELGCPLNNLAQEVAAVDEALRKRIEAVFAAWRGAIADALRRAQRTGRARRDFDPVVVATFILAALEGSISLAKSARSEALYRLNMTLLSAFVAGLGEPS